MIDHASGTVAAKTDVIKFEVKYVGQAYGKRLQRLGPVSHNRQFLTSTRLSRRTRVEPLLLLTLGRKMLTSTTSCSLP